MLHLPFCHFSLIVTRLQTSHVSVPRPPRNCTCSFSFEEQIAPLDLAAELRQISSFMDQCVVCPDGCAIRSSRNQLLTIPQCHLLVVMIVFLKATVKVTSPLHILGCMQAESALCGYLIRWLVGWAWIWEVLLGSSLSSMVQHPKSKSPRNPCSCI